jgi:hypothetical protein
MNVERQRVLSRLQLELARIEFMEQKTDRALEISQQIVDEMAPLLTDFDRVRLLPLYSEASYIASESARSLGDETGARSLARQALEVIGLQESDPVETRVYATVLSYIAGSEEAATLMAEISGSEYRAEPYLTGTDSGTWWRSNVSFQNL